VGRAEHSEHERRLAWVLEAEPYTLGTLHARGVTPARRFDYNNFMPDLWDLVWGKPYVDAAALADAIEREATRPDLDFRTRLLIRDGTEALASHWGRQRVQRWLGASPVGQQIEVIRQEKFGEVGFPSLKERLVDAITPATVQAYLRELAGHLHRPIRLVVGGSVALILAGYLSRSTEDIDVVDEVPAVLREQHALLDELRKAYGLQLTHFQSHFLPSGWEERLHSLAPVGQLQVALVDVYDLLLGKLFSARRKDRDDLRMLLPALDSETLLRRLRDTCGAFLADAALRQHAEQNWFVLTGQELP
jgi:hypothetical protein